MRKIAMVLIILMLTPAAGLASRKGDGGKGRMGMISELGLDQEQMEAVRNVRNDMRREMIRIKSDMELKKIDFHEELQKEKPDKARLDKLIDEISALAADRSRIMLKTRVNMVELLTPEQKKKLVERMGERMMMGSRGRHGGCDTDDKRPHND